MTVADRSIEFSVPPGRWATAPPERRGSRRDGVRLMVADRETGSIRHALFRAVDEMLRPGDVVVVNVSGTLAASLPARDENGRAVRLHLASPAAGGCWSVEVRTPTRGGGTTPGPELEPQRLQLPGGASARLLRRDPPAGRLWSAMLEGAGDPSSYLVAHGQPIRYTPGRRWPMSDYQTLFAAEPGSAEMPSAGRPFTTRLVTRLVTAGVAVLPIVLHAGVSSYEEGEAPGAERFRVPEPTARLANAARAGGGRLVAVGTTVVRALESVVDAAGTLHPDEGVTDLVITPERGVRAVDALVTGWHEPRSSHLRMLEAIAGRALLERSYAEAVDHGYLWHEFGDSLLVGDGFNEGSAAGQA